MFVNIKPMHCLAVIPARRITPGGNVELEESDTHFALLQPGRVALRRVALPPPVRACFHSQKRPFRTDVPGGTDASARNGHFRGNLLVADVLVCVVASVANLALELAAGD